MLGEVLAFSELSSPERDSAWDAPNRPAIPHCNEQAEYFYYGENGVRRHQPAVSREWDSPVDSRRKALSSEGSW